MNQPRRTPCLTPWPLTMNRHDHHGADKLHEIDAKAGFRGHGRAELYGVDRAARGDEERTEKGLVSGEDDVHGVDFRYGVYWS